ncbi:hypothetical protein IH779_02670, partial [Patescibacteria group bacterium]|nr:hypothetical protein [Patescibacteria group bacterium]
DFTTRRQRSGWKLLQGGATKKSAIFQLPLRAGEFRQASLLLVAYDALRHRITPRASNLA